MHCRYHIQSTPRFAADQGLLVDLLPMSELTGIWLVPFCDWSSATVTNWSKNVSASTTSREEKMKQVCFWPSPFVHAVVMALVAVIVRRLTITVRSGAKERKFWGARLDVLIFKLRSYHVLISYSAECIGPKFHKTLMFSGQAGMFL